ncbi:Muscle-specific protein 20 [Armadillidium nasatum]|uniref:Muscle-specific protein 20 n=1 Tax=Armadillidium nasatum TaxID=96803 RepID=A0A5N5SK04_9CRUS|nr:Muscle-specific protein 20 [Armadillidium nasatum]
MFRRPEPGKEKECLEWISTVLREQFPQGVPLRKILQDGQVLCRVINKLAPGSVKKIHSSGSEFKFMENINNFTEACRKYGVPNTDLFQTVDLWEGKDFHNVIATLYALGRTTYTHPEWPGPWLGPRPAEEQKREWTEEQLRASSNVIGMQAGYNKGATQAGDHFGATRKVLLGK